MPNEPFLDIALLRLKKKGNFVASTVNHSINSTATRHDCRVESQHKIRFKTQSSWLNSIKTSEKLAK